MEREATLEHETLRSALLRIAELWRDLAVEAERLAAEDEAKS